MTADPSPHTAGAQPIDPDLAATLQRFAQLDADTATPGMDYVQRRRWLSQLQAQLIRHPVSGVMQHMHFIACAGREIAVRAYKAPCVPGTPCAPSAPGAPELAPLVWLHGGGWMVGDLNTHDDLCERLAGFTGRTVLSVHYRRTPENPFPAPLDDVMAVLVWLQQMQGQLPWALPQVLLGGDSAGAHLALAAAVRQLQGKAENGTAIAGLLLLYPPLLPQQATPSMQAFAQGFGLTPQAMQHYWQALGTPSALQAGWHHPSLCTAHIAQLPPAVLMTASHDILRDEAEDFAAQAQSLGAPLQCLRAPGMVHGFARMLAASPQASKQVQRACYALEHMLQSQECRARPSSP